MKVNLIKLRNILGIEEVEFQPTPAGLTVIKGRNDVGKTSILSGVLGAVKKGYDATLLRKGETEGEVVIVLEYQGSNYEINREITPSGQSPTVKKDGVKMGRPQSIIDALFPDILVFNPRAFMEGTAAQRLEMLLDLVKIEVTQEEMMQATGGILGIPPNRPADLSIIEAAHDKLYAARADKRSALDEKRKTAAGLKSQIPKEVEEAKSEDIEEARNHYEKTNAAYQSRKATANKILETETGKRKAELEAELGKLREEFEAKCAAAREKSEADINEMRGECAVACERLDSEWLPLLNVASQRVAKAQALLEEHSRVQTLAKMVTQYEAEAKTLEAEWKGLDEAVKGVRELKNSKLAALPIKNLTIEGGEMLVGDIPFPRLNTAKKLQATMTVVKYRAKQTGCNFVILDGLELLDAEMMDGLASFCAKNDLQVCCTRVTEGPLTIATSKGEVQPNATR